MEYEASRNPYFRKFVFETFGNIKDRKELYKKIWEYVRNNFIYQDDLFDESLTSPKLMIDIKFGDCDDFALFIKSVLTVLNIPAFYLIAGTENEYSHILVYADGYFIDGTNKKFNYLDDNIFKNRALVI
ncbi:transglutaminase-like domain-containing protein [Melioribacter roseus]|nr:transglutaminase-like domain-containing protein [Melioribacter roseus]